MNSVDTSTALPEAAARCPFHTPSADASPAFSVVEVLNGFVRLAKRSETLNGSVPVRSAACKPFMEGNKAGLHVWFREPMMLSRDEELPALQMTDELFERVHGG